MLDGRATCSELPAAISFESYKLDVGIRFPLAAGSNEHGLVDVNLVWCKDALAIT